MLKTLKTKKILMSSVLIGVFAIGIFGTAEAQFFKSLFWKKRGVTESWSATSTNGAPAVGAIGIWTGSNMITYGANSMTTSVGGVYNPVTNVWTSVAANSVLAGKAFIAGGWAGSRFAIWGGATQTAGPPDKNGFPTTEFTPVNTGAMYNPSSDAWTTISASGRPAARRSHTAVVVGNRVIFWGGIGSSGQNINTGGVFTPASNTWSTVTISGAPTARGSHGAVGTATQMIIWGGFNNGPAPQNTGGRYTVSSNSWAATSTSGAPSARFGHSMVWTGSRVIVWGGAADFGTSGLNTGAVYNPTNNTWTAMSTVGAPIGRINHRAVWTGSKMIVWGGSDTALGGTFYNTGGVYNPTTNTWEGPTTLVGAPSVRSNHVELWTGSQMIVWGAVTNTGSRYTPAP